MLKNTDYNTRDKALVRRELGAELGSFVESMRRFVQRTSKSPIIMTSTTSSSNSPGRSTNVLSKSDEKFLKVVSSIVHNIYK